MIVAKAKRIQFVSSRDISSLFLHNRFHCQILFLSTTTHNKKDSMNDSILADNYLLELQRQWKEQDEGA
jgi:hypothetical protein